MITIINTKAIIAHPTILTIKIPLSSVVKIDWKTLIAHSVPSLIV